MRRLLVFAFVLLAVTSAAAQYTFTSLDYPGAKNTSITGINERGDMVGQWTSPLGGGHAMLLQRGQYIPLMIPGAIRSNAYKLNDAGDVAGVYFDENYFLHAFVLSKGVVTTLDYPGADETYAMGINETGTVVGFWMMLDATGEPVESHGFVWKNGSFTDVNFPGVLNTAVMGINQRGDLVGGWATYMDAPLHGYVYTQGKFISFDVPFAGGWNTQPNDINALGHIAGLYLDENGMCRGFVAVGADFTKIDFPGADQTYVWGINSAGQISGRYYIGSNYWRGYLAEPVKPAKP